MWKIKAGIFATIMIAVLAIILEDSSSVERETKAAFVARLGHEPGLSFDPQYDRGVSCGSYRLADRSRRRFIFISRLSAEQSELQGLHLDADSGFPSLDARLCR